MITQPRPSLASGQQVALAAHRSNPMDWHASHVVHVDESLLWVASPPTDLKPAWPAEGDELFVRIVPSGEAAVKLHARVVVLETEPERLLGLRIIGSSPTPQRESFRVPVSITTEEATLIHLGGSRFPAALHLRDLSGTGLRAHCDAPVSIGDQIWMRLRLTGQPQPIEVTASVVRCYERPGPAGTYWEIGGAFTKIAPTVRERIVQFALGVQLEQRRRGTLQ